MRECGNRGWGGVRSSEAVESDELEGEMYHRCAMATWWSTPLLRSGWSRIDLAMPALAVFDLRLLAGGPDLR